MNQMTKVVGYFNPNDYPMQLIVSEHNLTLNLPPKSYVVDRDQRLVNDPLLDHYVGKGRLSRATGQKEVQVILLAPLNRQPQPGQTANAYQHAVSEAVGFQKDAYGQTQPIIAKESVPVAAVPPPVSYNPVKALTVEQAKQLRLIKPTRRVPEDFGVDDGQGAPLAGEKVPYITHARDTTKAQVEPLPEVVAKEINPTTKALVDSMGQASSAPDIDEEPDVVARAIKEVTANPIAPPAPVAPPPPASSEPILEELRKPTAPPIPSNPQPTEIQLNQPLPDPILEDDSGLVVDEEIPAKPGAAVPPPPLDDDLEGTTVSPPQPTSSVLTCPKCPGVQCTTPGYLKRHINRKHPDEAVEMLADLHMS
jgi:hypothetical protein